MRLTTVNPLPYTPKDELERELCDRVRTLSGEMVIQVWTPNSYPYEDVHGNQVALDADYEIKTGRLSEGLVASGSIYRAFVRDGRLDIEPEGAWNE